jgi:hypothetical protein
MNSVARFAEASTPATKGKQAADYFLAGVISETGKSQ